MRGRSRLVNTLPLLLSKGDQIRTFNASQPVWATILDVTANSHWTYLKVESSYIPDPYLVRLPSHRRIEAKKLTPWREKPPPEAEKDPKGVIPVKTDLHPRKEQQNRRLSYLAPTRDWDQPKRDQWIKNETRTKDKPDDEIGFVPDPWLEKERQRKAAEKRRKRQAKRKRRKDRKAQEKPSLLPYYQILGCRAGNRWSTIKKRFKKLAFAHHPDRNPGDAGAEGRFKKINDAFIRLSNALSK